MTRGTPIPTRLLLIVLTLNLWAASTSGAAHFHGQAKVASGKRPRSQVAERSKRGQLPQTVSFREVRNRGLLIDAWINGQGPFTFALDTGAGTTLISERVAAAAQLAGTGGRRTSLAGITGNAPIEGRESVIRSLALGEPNNLLPANSRAMITTNLPPSIDGILDTTEAFWPWGYSIDIPNQLIEAFDPALKPLSASHPPPEGTVVRWLTESGSRRPFVRLSDGRLALLDTGSGFGLALSGASAGEARTRNRGDVQDIGGGTVMSRRVQPSTVSIGSLTLRGVPTDILSGVERNSPILLGRDALDPFKLVFDPLNRLIAIQPVD
jgi:hypothetical protein